MAPNPNMTGGGVDVSGGDETADEVDPKRGGGEVDVVRQVDGAGEDLADDFAPHQRLMEQMDQADLHVYA